MSTRTVQDALDQDYSLSVTYLPSGKTVSFSGYINSFNDSFKQNWTPDEVYGRMDPILYYKNTGRTISIELDVPADSESEGVSNFQKLEALMSFCYPVYEQQGKFIFTPQDTPQLTQAVSSPQASKLGGGNAMLLSQPPLVAVKFANLISSTGLGGKLIGKFDDITYRMDNELGFFHVNNNLIPKFFKLNINMTVLHSGPLGWQKNGNKVELRDSKYGPARFPYGV